jgi:outer membrane immunogenic protein
MKAKISLVALATALSMGSAIAADLPSLKAPVFVPPPPPLWTGPYAGLNAGYAIDTDPTTSTVSGPLSGNIDGYWNCAIPGPGACVTSSFASALGLAGIGQTTAAADGFVGGGQIGYNYQFYQRFVAGFEADIQGSGAKGDGSFLSGAGATMLRGNFVSSRNFVLLNGTEVEKSLDWIGTVRGRIGWLVTPPLLLYVTGGLAYGGVSGQTNVFQAATLSPPGFGQWSTSANGGVGRWQQTQFGWTIGGGAEWLIAPNWSIKGEALYYDLGSVNHNTSLTSWTVTRGRSGETESDYAISQTTSRFNGVMIRAGVNYHFNWAPALAVLVTQ